MSCHPNTDLQTNLVHSPQTNIVTQRLICTRLLSKSRDISFHPNTDLHKTWFTIQRHIFVTQRLICTKAWFTILSPKDCFIQTNLIHNPETYISCHSKTDLYTEMIHKIHRQTFLSPKYWLATQTWFTTPDANQKKGSIFKETDHHTNLSKP